MKKQFDIKKLVLLNLPYLLMGLFTTNFGEAWRLAQGANASEKFLSLFAVLPGALQSFWPSLHPLDLLVGLCCGAGLRLAVYLKSKNAKKYRHGMEYGSARWGTAKDIEPFTAPKFEDNIILTKTERLMMNRLLRFTRLRTTLTTLSGWDRLSSSMAAFHSLSRMPLALGMVVTVCPAKRLLPSISLPWLRAATRTLTKL